MIKTIYDRYPKVYNEIAKWWYENNKNLYSSIWAKCFEDDLNVLCYCEIESFFDKNKIYISIIHNSEGTKNGWDQDELFYFDIDDDPDGYNDNVGPFDSRPEAQKEAILKACEILNERLQDEND